MKLKKVVGYTLIIAVVVFVTGFGLVVRSIFVSVKQMCVEAAGEFEGDYVEALIGYVESPDHSFKEKNRAVWALAQIGDKRALPVLEVLYTGAGCDKPCNPDKHICQYEVDKAIRFCKDTNLVAAPLQRYLGLKQ